MGDNLPWIEKYRPTSLDEMISQEDAITTIKKYMNESRLPHLLFHGPPGTGKTSTILACARQLYPDINDYKTMVLELNASDDRGIVVVRDQILSFASTGTLFGSGCKLVVLDEADSMTNDAQNALRRIIERYTANARFCLICNFINSIIPALQSRCTRFRFVPLDQCNVVKRLRFISEKENIPVTDDGLKSLYSISNGDMRKAISCLQSTFIASNQTEVTEDSVYQYSSCPSPSEVRQIIFWCLNDPITNSIRKLSDLKKARSFTVSDIVSEVAKYVYTIQFQSEPKATVLNKLAGVERRIAKGASDQIQLACIANAFQSVRGMPPSLK